MINEDYQNDQRNHIMFLSLVKKYFPGVKINKNINDIPDNYITHTFYKSANTATRFLTLGIMEDVEYYISIEPDTNEYPRREIWQGGRWRRIMISYRAGINCDILRLKEQMESFEKEYNDLFLKTEVKESKKRGTKK